MRERTFIDTNVLVYADDAGASEKQKRARDAIAELVEAQRAVVSTQVLQEYFVAATRKLQMPAEEARLRVEALLHVDVVIVRGDLILSAIDLHRLRRISFWDALVVRSAEAAGCSVLLSEDLQHGDRIEGVRVENPFR